MLNAAKQDRIGGRVIRRLFKFEGQYHCVVQTYRGKIIHEKFPDEAKARKFLRQFNPTITLPVEHI